MKTSTGSIDGVTPVLEPPVYNTSTSVTTDVGTSKEKAEQEIQSTQELEDGQKLYLPLVLTLAGAAFLNVSLCVGLENRIYPC